MVAPRPADGGQGPAERRRASAWAIVAEHDTVLVVDFGSQFAQLIARRVREERIYSEIVPHTISAAELASRARTRA